MQTTKIYLSVKKILAVSLFILFLYLNSLCLAFTLPEDYVKDGAGVRPLGMGGAYTAISGDINSVFYNPAGLDSIAPFNYVYGNVDQNKGLSDVNLYTIYNFGNFCYARVVRDSSTEAGVETSYYSFGQRGSFGLSYGLTYKTIRWEGPTNSEQGYGCDLGIMSRLTPELSLGLLWQDFASSKDLDMPQTTRLGISYKLWNNSVMLAADTENGRSEPGNYTYYGLEWKTSDVFAVRCGSYRGNSTMGFSISSPLMVINYGVLNDSDVDGGSVQMFSIETNFFETQKRPFSVMRPKEFALIDIGGSLVGGIGEFSLIDGGKVGADTITANIKEAVEDPYIDGIIIRIRGFEGGLGSTGIIQEIREELKKAKASGKKVIAYIESSAFGDEYYLASVADHIVAPTNASVGGIGKSFSITRIKGLLEKIGVEAEILSKGKYKTTFSMYESGLSAEQDKMLKILLSELHRQTVDDIALDRPSVPKKELKDIADGRIMSAKKAMNMGLIDEIGYFKDAAESGAKLMGSEEEPLIVERKNLLLQEEEDVLIAFPNKIAVIEINGDIVIGKSGQNILFGGSATGADTVTEQIRRAADDWQVKALIVRINSGGGSAIASSQIYSELLRARGKGKIVVASLGDVAASGGYYIACAADRIVSNPGTITGSIGVIGGGKLVMKELFDKIGVKVEVLKEGKHADMFSSMRKLTTEEAGYLVDIMDETYDDFVSAVAQGRNLTTAEAYDVAEGKIYIGSQALDLKLVDALGNMSDAVDEAAKLAGIGGRPKLIYYREQNFWLGIGGGAVKALGLDQGLFPNLKSELTEFSIY